MTDPAKTGGCSTNDIAAKDGTEAIAEIEVLIGRKDVVPEVGMILYRSKMR